MHCRGVFQFHPSAKIKTFEVSLKTFGNVAMKKAQALRQIALWDVEELDKREEARRDFKSWALAEEIH